MTTLEMLIVRHGEPFSGPVIALVSLLILLSISTVLGNAIVILVLLKDPCHNLRSQVATVLVFNLAIADLLLGLVIEPIFCVFLLSSVPEESYDHMKAFVTLAVKASCLTLVAIGIERWIVVEMPLRAMSIQTPRRVGITVGVIWLLAALIASSPYLGIHLNDIYFHSLMFDIVTSLLLITLVCVYGRIWVLVRRSTSFRMQFKTYTNASNKVEKQPLVAETQTQLYIRRERIREAKMARTFYIVCGSFILCWLPSILYVNIYRRDQSLTFKFLFLAGLLNSALNPMIYSLKSEKFRQALRNILQRSCRRS